MAEILPINREGGGQTQLQEKNGAVPAVPQPTYPAINIPDVITPDFFNRPPSADRQRIENELQQRRQEYLTSFQQTAREQQLQQESIDLETELSNLRQSEQKGLLNIEQQRIAMPLITGQQSALQRQAQLERGDVLAQLESKQKALGFEFAKREGIMAKAKAVLGFAETDLDRIQKIEENQQRINQSILDYSLKLSDNARQVFGTILQQFDGMGWDQLSPSAQTQLAQTAMQAGVPTQVLAEAMNAQKDQKDIELKKQELEFDKIRGDIKQQQFSQDLAQKKFEEDKRQFGVNYALKKQEMEKEDTYKPPVSYQEWELAGKPGTYANWLKEQNIKAPTQAQQTVSEYAARIEQANPMIESLQDSIKNMNYISFAAQLKLPSAFQSTDIQQYMQAARNFINAKLRRESGAVIANSEFVEARQQYLPQAGDSDEVLASKKANRDLVYSALRKASGNAYQSVDELLNETGGKIILEGATSSGMKYKVIE